MTQAIAQGRVADAESSKIIAAAGAGGHGGQERSQRSHSCLGVGRQGQQSGDRKRQEAAGLQDWWSMQQPHLSICSIKSELLCVSRLDFQTGPLLYEDTVLDLRLRRGGP